MHPDALEYTAEKLESNFDSFESHKANVYGKILFIGLEQNPGETDSDFVRRAEAAREDPCAAWSETNPFRDEEADDESYEDSPYGLGASAKWRLSLSMILRADRTKVAKMQARRWAARIA